MPNALRQIKDRINNYMETVIAIWSFMQLVVTNNSEHSVKCFQGRSMAVQPNHYLTPDIVIQIAEKFGIIGEVKITFSKDQSNWEDAFKQLRNYDNDLMGWVGPNGKIIDSSISYDIILLVNQLHSVNVEDYYVNNQKNKYTFRHQFCIVEFSRINQTEEITFLRTKYGSPSEYSNIAEELRIGVRIPRFDFVSRYPAAILYDVKPPMPYLLFFIYQYYLSQKAILLPEFSKIRRNGKVEISTNINEITKFLNDNYSFKILEPEKCTHQPSIPRRDWIIDAVNSLITLKLAKWEDQKTGKCILYYKRSCTMDKFEELCIANGIDVYEIDSQLILDYNLPGRHNAD